MERINGRTPSGGDYAELYYFDENGNIVEDKEKAVRGMIRECKENGELVCTTSFFVNKNENG